MEWVKNHFMYFLTVLAVLFWVMLLMAGLNSISNTNNNEPCEYFRSRSIQKTPARCLNYFLNNK